MVDSRQGVDLDLYAKPGCEARLLHKPRMQQRLQDIHNIDGRKEQHDFLDVQRQDALNMAN
eukprot:11045582-Prorocentrum_lima.AAC.1